MSKNKNNYYSESDGTNNFEDFTVDRRDFLKIAGAGITIFFTIGDLYALQQRRRWGRDYPKDFNAYLRIYEDGRVACYSGKIEMGQGIYTSLAMMLAEELQVPLASVDMVMGDTALCPWDSATVGSRSTKYFGPALRRAAAEARAVLVLLAAKELKVPQERLYVEDGVIIDKEDPETKISYAQIAKGKKIARYLEGEPSYEPYSEHTISGKSTLHADALLKVTGEAKFTGDIQLPGMLYARIVRPPAHGAKLKSIDLTAAEKVQGVKIIKDSDLIAVLHAFPDEAERALNLIKTQYDIGENKVDNRTIFKHLEESAPAAEIVTEQGSLEKGKNLAIKTFESTFFNHYVAHAPLETHTAVVDIANDEVKVWASTQAPFRVQSSVAEILGLSEEKVHVITPFVGGGFGGKTWSQQVSEAARLAKLTGKAVQVAWSRKEEFFYDSFRPAAIVKAKSGINQTGAIVYWDFELLFGGSRSSEPIYDIPHHRVLSRGAWRGDTSPHPFNVGAWRGPGSNTNVFAMESQTDIMAQAAGIDPFSFRMRNLSDERMKRVLQAAADKFGNSFSPGPSGKGYGIACTDYLGTYVATIAEVKVDKNNGKISVKRIVCAQDMGEVINPQGAKLQIEGGLTMGLGSVMSEEIKFKGGHILTENFDTYEITRFSWTPKIETVLIDNNEMEPQGCGEPAITTTAAVITNAVFDAIGVRMFELPMTPQRIKNALMRG
jgi:nicotinate dehydrogenase subunit B